MDERLSASPARALWLQLWTGLRPRPPVPCLLAARPLLRAGGRPAIAPQREAGKPHERAGRRAARRAPALLLPVRDQCRPPHRDPVLRHPPDEPRGPAAP